MNTCMLAHTQHQFLVFANKTTLVVGCACGHVISHLVVFHMNQSLFKLAVGDHTPATATEDNPAQPPHALVKYTKDPWLYPSPPLTKECSFVGRA